VWYNKKGEYYAWQDSMDIAKVIKEYKEHLLEHYKDNLGDIILFGSAARGEYTDESDIDVLVLLKAIPDLRVITAELLKTTMEFEKLYNDAFLISALPVRESDYLSQVTPFFLNVKKEGILL
jgi:predicted nucleotidyltransferase